MVTAGSSYYAPLAEMDFAKVRRSLDEHLVLALQVARQGAYQNYRLNWIVEWAREDSNLRPQPCENRTTPL
jgi:hypothetical protein